MKILYLSRWYPFPPNNGSKLRIYNLLHGLKEKHDVTLLTFAEQTEQNSHRSSHQMEWAHVVPWKPYDPSHVRARLGYFSTTPRFVIDTFSTEMACKVRQLLASAHFDLIIASQFDMAVYSPYFNHVPAIFEEVELGTLYEEFSGARFVWQRIRHGLTWAKHRHFLASLLANFKMCTVASSREKQLLHDRVKSSQAVEVVPNCVDVQSYQSVKASKLKTTLIFTGAFSYGPNYAAMQWFVQEVLPLVRAEVPETELVITGDHQGKSLPNVEGLTLAGFVDDVRPLVASATISIVPIHTGGGTRLKIVEAMALRTPVVATTKGAEGLDVVHGQHLLIADSCHDFAEAIVRLLHSTALQNGLAENAYQLVREKYDTQVVVPSFLDLIAQVVEN